MMFKVLSKMIDLLIQGYDKVRVKSDSEIIDDLLRKESDKRLFHDTISELQRTGKKSKTITLNNEEVTISI